MHAQTDPTSAHPSNVILLTRVFNAPRRLVWRAWTDPNHVAAWWGPKGFTTRVESCDFRVGGRSRYVMVGPDGAEYPATGVFIEIVEFERIVSTDEFADDFKAPEGMTLPTGIVLTVEFEDLGDKTRMVMRIAHPTPESRKLHEDMGVFAGWHSSFDCLDDFLAAEQGRDPAVQERSITMSRVFDAPPELVFKMWTDLEHLSRWWGPHGFATTTRSRELRPGGVWLFTMHGPDGVEYPNRVDFQEVIAPKRLAYRHSGDGGVTEGVGFNALVTFEAHPRGTLVNMRLTCDSIEGKRRIGEFGAEAGGLQTLERFDRLLRIMRCEHRLSVSRRINAPVPLVWRAWSEPEMLRKWLCPRACRVVSLTGEFRPGGRYHETMHCQGRDHTVSGEYFDIAPRRRIVFTHRWSEPGAPETIVTVTLAEDAGGTLVTLEQSGFASADSARGHTEGWTSALENLEEKLSVK